MADAVIEDGKTMTAETIPSAETWIALLGRRDEPVDGVEDYCTFLAPGMARQGVMLELERVAWDREGWLGALRKLSRRAHEWSGHWVLLQYTALGWSRRGFSLGALLAAWIVLRRGVRLAVVYHEPTRQLASTSWPDRVRGTFQDWIIQRLYARAEKVIFADPLETIAWLPPNHSKASFIPIGANMPEPYCEDSSSTRTAQDRSPLKVAIYCLSTLPNRERELSDIARAAAAAAGTGTRLRLIFLGRGTGESSDEIQRALAEIQSEVEILGIRSAGNVSSVLSASDVMLSVRGPLFPRRGSVIAGIACGLPIVAYGNGKSAFPLSEAGVELAPWREPEALSNAFVRVAQNPELRRALREKSHRAYQQFLSWDAIAKSFRSALAQNSGTE